MLCYVETYYQMWSGRPLLFHLSTGLYTVFYNCKRLTGGVRHAQHSQVALNHADYTN